MSDLVIGIGNPLRGDDGVGWQLAEAAGRLRPAPAVRAVQQLTPELVEELAGARRVLFVDAWLVPAPAEAPPGAEGADGSSPQPLLRPLAAAGSAGREGGGAAGGEPGPFSHALDPAGLLALTALLEGVAPPAWELLVPAFAFPHGPVLSPRLRRGLPRALALLRGWLADA